LSLSIPGVEMAGTKFSAIEPEIEDEILKYSSDRSLGLVFAAAFCLLGLLPLMHGRSPKFAFLLLACLFVLAAICAPQVLGPLNIVWTRLGAFLHRIVTPLVMGFVFFAVLTPVAWIMRILGNDPLRLARDASASSYWIERQPPGPNPQSMVRQF
jgi:hypothetical protein